MKYPQLVSMPSEISDWLDEQLEARGIDAVVYTRYVLSLLHRDPVDVVCPDQDLHFIQSHKEVRCSGSGHKHFRCFKGWRDYLQADAEKLKRTAAIECLMSASDQNCGIETLVDELCEKLKEIKNKTLANTDSAIIPVSSKPQTISPQDLAQKYYAAFPPLTKHCRAPGTPTSIVTLIPKWFSSPKKKSSRRQNRSASFEEKLHYKVETDMRPRLCGKQKSGYFSRSRNDLGYSRSMAKSLERSESMADWDSLMFGNNNSNNFLDNNSNEFANIVEEKVSHAEKQNRMLWSDEESMTICDDLPVDILDLLDSPGPQGYTVEMMNLANMRDGGNKNFIQCGTNITSSIWSVDAVMDDSVFDNTYNTVVDADQSETLLGIKFKSLTVGNKSIESIWSNPDIAQNERNLLFESYHKSSLVSENPFSSLDSWDYASGLEKLEKWSEAEYFDGEAHLNSVYKSLIKLNHSKEESSFTEVITKSGISFCNKPSNPVPAVSQPDSVRNSESAEKEDLLTSIRSHFRPINAIPDINDGKNQQQYADGTSFVISGNLENPVYTRSTSGSQYLAVEKGSPKKLMDYITKNGKPSKSSLVLKFFVQQNDIACQTDDMIMDCELDNSEVPCKKRVVSEPEEFFFPGDEHEANLFNCTCFKNMNKGYGKEPLSSFGDDIVACQVHVVRPDSMLAEMWKGDAKLCDQCNKNSIKWANTDLTESWKIDKESLESIWNGEVCQTCISLNGGPLPRNAQLREDVSQDGEQLLSDLSMLQKSYYMELPAAEISYDISELLTGNKERKRRHSPLYESAKNAIPVHRGSWNINSFMQVATVPVLHSVTL